MAAIILLIGFSLAIAVGFLVSFILSVHSGQYDDTYTPSIRILLEDSNNEKSKEKKVNHEWSIVNSSTRKISTTTKS
jgi:cbb3-type cytochrome oxidase maturation protein